MSNEFKLKQALSDLLEEKTFLLEGGTMDFRLLYKYPISKTEGRNLESNSVLQHICLSLGLELKLKVIYKETYGSVLILADQFVDFGYVNTLFRSLICKENEEEYEWFPPKCFTIKSRGLKENGEWQI